MRWPYKLRKKEGCPFKIPKLSGLLYKWDCLMENIYIRISKLPEKGVYDEKGRKEKVIVSLTSFPERIEQCYYAIKSLMIQNYKADQIVLWLAEEQFPTHVLPQNYEELIKRGLTVRYCKEDLRSHKKYFYVLQEQKEDEVVITFDDDIIYEFDAISKLIHLHNKYPRCVVCNRGHHIISSNNKILPYKEWKVCSKEGVYEPSIKIMPSTGMGCLYPFAIMPNSTFNMELIKENAFTADDIWMFFNRLKADIPVVKTKEKIAILCTVYGSQTKALTYLNDLGDENERTIERMQQIFPGVLEKCL